MKIRLQIDCVESFLEMVWIYFAVIDFTEQMNQQTDDEGYSSSGLGEIFISNLAENFRFLVNDVARFLFAHNLCNNSNRMKSKSFQ